MKAVFSIFQELLADLAPDPTGQPHPPRLCDPMALLSPQLNAPSSWGPWDREPICPLQATGTSQPRDGSLLGQASIPVQVGT